MDTKAVKGSEKEKPVVLVKYGKEVDALPVGDGESVHFVVAKRFCIPIERLSLICRGRKYTQSEKNTTKEILEQCKKGIHVLVLGTPSKDQLDEPRGPLSILTKFPVIGRPMARILILSWNFFFRGWCLISPFLSGFAYETLRLVRLFVTTLIPWPSSFTNQQRRQHQDERPHYE